MKRLNLPVGVLAMILTKRPPRISHKWQPVIATAHSRPWQSIHPCLFVDI